MIGKEFSLLVDAMIIGVGIYQFFSMMRMKKTGKLESGFMISKSIDITTAKDPAGYIAYMYMKTIVVCALVVILGIFQLISDYTEGFGVLPAISSVIILVVLIIYGIASVKAQKKYL